MKPALFFYQYSSTPTLHYSNVVLKHSGFTNNLPDPDIKKIILVGGLEQESGIRSVTGAADGDDIAARKSAGVRSHYRDFHRNLGALTEEP